MTVHVLGRVGCTDDNGTYHELVGHEATLLSILVARRTEAVPTDALIDGLWNDDPPKTARQALHLYVARLRGRLPAGAVVTVGATYRLTLLDDEIDAARFERDVKAALEAGNSGEHQRATAALRAALDRWLEPPFGIAGECEALTYESERLREIARNGEDALSLALLRSGADPDVDRLRLLVERQPFRENRWAYLMTGLYRAGRQREALQAYQELRTTLVEELGVEPNPTLKALNDRILDQDPALLAPPIRRVSEPTSLPADPTRFVGRGSDLARVLDLCSEHRLVVVTGTGGVGKSRLALAVARTLVAEYPGGVFLVPLSPLERGADVEDAVAGALGGGARPGISTFESIVRSLEGTGTLLLLDNAEQVAESVADLAARLLERCPGLSILVTSQHPLQVLGEAIWALQPLAVPEDPTGPSDAIDLFVEAAQRAAPDTPLDQAYRPVIAAICRKLDGIPLALELAASRLASLSPAELLSTLDQPLAALHSPRHTTQPHHRTLEALVEWSYQLLSDDERYALHMVSLFPGGCSLDALAAVADLERAVAADVLDRLNRKSLLTPIPTAAGRRFGLLGSVMAYVEQHADHGIGLEPALERRMAWALELSRREGPLVYIDTERALAALEADGANLRASIRWSTAQGHLHESLRTGHSLLWFWTFGGHLDDGRETFSSVLDQVGDLPSRERARALHGSGVIAAFDTDYDRAYAALGEAAGLFASLDDRSNLAWTRFWTGRTISAQVFAGQAGIDRLIDADLAYHEADAIFSDREDPVGLTFTRMFQGWNSLMLGEPERAHEILTGALAVAEAIEATQPTGMLNGMLAAVLAHTGHLVEADQRAVRSVELLNQVGDKMNSQICEAVSAMVACAADDLPEARARLLRALELQERHGSREWDGFTLYVTMAVLAQLGDDVTPGLIAASLDRFRPHWREVQQNLGFPALGPTVSVTAAPVALPIVDLLRRCLRAVDAFS